eukprot:399876_1
MCSTYSFWALEFGYGTNISFNKKKRKKIVVSMILDHWIKTIFEPNRHRNMNFDFMAATIYLYLQPMLKQYRNSIVVEYDEDYCRMPGRYTTKITNIPKLHTITSQITISFFLTIENHGYGYVVSRNEWTQCFSIGVLASHDRNRCIRAAVQLKNGHIVLHTKLSVKTFFKYHVVFVYGHGEITFYINGKLNARKGCQEGEIIYKTTKTHPLWIGHEHYLNGRHSFCGSIEKLYIFNFAFDDDEAAAFYDEISDE